MQIFNSLFSSVYNFFSIIERRNLDFSFTYYESCHLNDRDIIDFRVINNNQEEEISYNLLTFQYLRDIILGSMNFVSVCFVVLNNSNIVS